MRAAGGCFFESAALARLPLLSAEKPEVSGFTSVIVCVSSEHRDQTLLITREVG